MTGVTNNPSRPLIGVQVAELGTPPAQGALLVTDTTAAPMTPAERVRRMLGRPGDNPLARAPTPPPPASVPAVQAPVIKTPEPQHRVTPVVVTTAPQPIVAAAPRPVVASTHPGPMGPPIPTGPIKDARVVPGLDLPPVIDAPERDGAPKQILFIGDSHTPAIAQGASNAAGGALEHVSVLHTDGTQLRRWFPQPHYRNTRETIERHAQLVQALARHPQEVVVSLGTNDGGDYPKNPQAPGGRDMIAVNDDTIRRNVREMVGLVRSNGAHLTWALPPTTTDEHDGVDRAREVIRSELAIIQNQIDAETQARGAPPYKIDVVDISHTKLPMDNGLHPDSDGYAIWGRFLWKSYGA